MTDFDKWLSSLKEDLNEVSQSLEEAQRPIDSEPSSPRPYAEVRSSVHSVGHSQPIVFNHHVLDSVSSLPTEAPASDVTKSNGFDAVLASVTSDTFKNERLVIPPQVTEESYENDDFEQAPASPSVLHSSPVRSLASPTKSPSMKSIEKIQKPIRPPTAETSGLCILHCPGCRGVIPFRVPPELYLSGILPNGMFKSGGRDLWKECGLTESVTGDFKIIQKFEGRVFDFSPVLSVHQIFAGNSKLPAFAQRFINGYNELSEGRPVAAQGMFSSLALPPPLAFWWQGLCLIDQGKKEEAQEMCRKSLASLALGIFSLPLHWNWAVLYAEFAGRPGNRKFWHAAAVRELSEVKRIARSFNPVGHRAGKRCPICGKTASW